MSVFGDLVFGDEHNIRGGGSFEQQLMPKGLKGMFAAATTVADYENSDRDSEGSSVEQQAFHLILLFITIYQ
jgi:hypothetical protein